MITSIARLARLIPNRPMVPVVMLVVGMNVTPDPTRRATGYGGVLPVPRAQTSGTAPRRLDPLLEQQRRDVRAARGRVLYSPGRAPQAEPAKAHETHPCPERRVVQGRTGAIAPAS